MASSCRLAIVRLGWLAPFVVTPGWALAYAYQLRAA